jgi:hypothetical protein
MAAQRKTQKKTSTRRAPTQKTNLQKEFLDKAEGRLKELKPLVDEYNELEEAVAALKGTGSASGGSAGGAAAPTPTRRGPGRPRGSRSKSSSNGRGRPKGSGKRAQEVLNQVRNNPGVRIPELAKALKMDSAAYLYKVVPQLVEDGKLVKDGKGYKLSSQN